MRRQLRTDIVKGGYYHLPVMHYGQTIIEQLNKQILKVVLNDSSSS